METVTSKFKFCFLESAGIFFHFFFKLFIFIIYLSIYLAAWGLGCSMQAL